MKLVETNHRIVVLEATYADVIPKKQYDNLYDMYLAINLEIQGIKDENEALTNAFKLFNFTNYILYNNRSKTEERKEVA